MTIVTSRSTGWLCCLAAAISCLGMSTGAHALVIDSFDTNQTTIVVEPDSAADNQASGAGILGGERDVEVTRVSGVGVTAAASNGTLSYGHIGSSQGTVLIVWDGGDGDLALDPTGLGGVDFTDGGVSTHIGLSILLNDLSASITFIAYTDAVNFSTANVSLPGDIPPDPAVWLTIAFADFVATGGSGVDFENVGALSLLIDGSSISALDVELDSVVTISPEPSTGSLLLLGLAAFAWARRRSGRSQVARARVA